ncbi:MAG: TIGR02206 family membrane protein, partial [Solirubrobacteraceae bacterium]
VRGTWTARYDLPLQLTDAVSVAAVAALLTRRRTAVELTWFWGLSASLQATLTPDLGQSFPSVYYFTYFGYHVGAVVAALMLVLGCGIYPRPRAAWWAFGLALCWATLAGIADAISGANYMYLRFRPPHGSLLSAFGHWPWYRRRGARRARDAARAAVAGAAREPPRPAVGHRLTSGPARASTRRVQP